MMSWYGKVSTLLSLYEGNSPVTGGFSSQSFMNDTFFVVSLYKLSNKQLGCWWLGTPWHQCNVLYLTADWRLAHSQWETLLQNNPVSHWLSANLESSPYLVHPAAQTVVLHRLPILSRVLWDINMQYIPDHSRPIIHLPYNLLLCNLLL